ncbi:hypothetical protein GH146_00950 [archaeon]|nr:hypothetical protein [archaeon]
MLAWKCLNPKCNRIIYQLARISNETKPSTRQRFPGESGRTITEKYCCPFCLSIEFKPTEVHVEPE